MSALLVALALFTAQQDAGPSQDPGASAAPPAAAEDAGPAFPVGAPRDDYGLVSWCYGALRGYLDLHDQVMPEVTRIETTWRRPGAKLSDDMKVYDDMRRDGQKNLKLFARAMEAAEKASIKPIGPIGAAAVRQGAATWAAAPQMPPARVAQEWMSWALPARCETTATSLESRAKLLGSAFQVNSDSDAPGVTAPPPSGPAPRS
jgi:hypothetical protein